MPGHSLVRFNRLALILLLLSVSPIPSSAQVPVDLAQIERVLDSIQTKIDGQQAVLKDFITAYVTLDARGAVRGERSRYSVGLDRSDSMARYTAARILQLPHPYGYSRFLSLEAPFDPPVVLAGGRFVGGSVRDLERFYDTLVDQIPGVLAEIRRLDGERQGLEAERNWQLQGRGEPRTQGPVTGRGRRPSVDSVVAEGNRLLLETDFQGARSKFDEALQLDSQHPGAYLGRGMTHYFLNDNRAAASDLDEAVDLDPENGYPLFWRGVLRQGRLQLEDLAVEDYRAGCELKNEDACASLRSMADDAEVEGSGAYQQGDYSSALAWFDEAIRIDWTYPDPYFNRGLTRSKLGDHRSAIEDFLSFIRHRERYDEYARARPIPVLEPDPKGVASAYARIGLAYLELGQPGQAIEPLQRAVAQATVNDPANASTYGLWTAQAYERNGDRRNAYLIYARLCEQDLQQACAERDRIGGGNP